MTLVQKFIDNNRGVAAVEFALILPVLVILLIGSAAAFDFYRADKAVSSSANTTVDLTARQSAIDVSISNSLFATGRALLGRYSTDASLSMSIASIINDGEDITVDWARQSGGGSLITDDDLTSIDLPDIPENESVIYVLFENEYTPLFGSKINFTREVIRRPRFVAQIAFDAS